MGGDPEQPFVAEFSRRQKYQPHELPAVLLDLSNDSTVHARLSVDWD
jgi:hypothetical protein